MVKRDEKNGIKVWKFGQKTYKPTAMAHPIRPNYKHTCLFPHSLEELIPADHPVRFLRACVDALDWEGLGFYEGCEGFGRGDIQ